VDKSLLIVYPGCKAGLYSRLKAALVSTMLMGGFFYWRMYGKADRILMGVAMMEYTIATYYVV
jgi:hypothetical protein